MKRLVDEHVLIKRWVALILEVLKDLDIESEDGSQLILDGVDFIRSYADRYHHGKEEEILLTILKVSCFLILLMLGKIRASLSECSNHCVLLLNCKTECQAKKRGDSKPLILPFAGATWWVSYRRMKTP